LVKKIVFTLLLLILALAVAVTAINLYVVSSVKNQILTADEAAAYMAENGQASCILVLGASVKNGEPSPILANRLDMGMTLFEKDASDIMLLSGDNGRREYNEVQGMKNYVLANGEDIDLLAKNIYLDYAGFSTYDSLYRCKEIFEADRVIIVTQKYHLYRALYIAKQRGLDAYGVAAEDKTSGQTARDIREIAARVKDFGLTLIAYKPAVLGEPVPLIYPSTQE
jgi:vancomycin permeability regulator SanA